MNLQTRKHPVRNTPGVFCSSGLIDGCLMPGTYNGGGTLITVRRCDGDMTRRKNHLKNKMAREQERYDRMTQSQRIEYDRENRIKR